MLIFISYSRLDSEQTKALSAALNRMGQEHWMDTELHGGQQWWDAILENIRGADVFVACLSRHFSQSEACQLELEYAVALGKPLIPVSLDPELDIELLGTQIEKRQVINFTTDRWESVADITRAISNAQPSQEQPASLPAAPELPTSYIGLLIDRVRSTERLDLEDQESIYLRAKQACSEDAKAEQGREVLALLLKRGDVYASIASEARSTLERPGRMRRFSIRSLFARERNKRRLLASESERTESEPSLHFAALSTRVALGAAALLLLLWLRTSEWILETIDLDYELFNTDYEPNNSLARASLAGLLLCVTITLIRGRDTASSWLRLTTVVAASASIGGTINNSWHQGYVAAKYERRQNDLARVAEIAETATSVQTIVTRFVESLDTQYPNGTLEGIDQAQLVAAWSDALESTSSNASNMARRLTGEAVILDDSYLSSRLAEAAELLEADYEEFNSGFGSMFEGRDTVRLELVKTRSHGMIRQVGTVLRVSTTALATRHAF